MGLVKERDRVVNANRTPNQQVSIIDDIIMSTRTQVEAITKEIFDTKE